MPAEDDRQHPVPLEPALRPRQPLGVQVHVLGVPAPDQTRTEPLREVIEIRRAEHDGEDQTEPGRDPRHRVLGNVGADVHDEHVAGRRERDARLLDVKRRVPRQVVVLGVKSPQVAHRVLEQLRQIALEDRDHDHGRQQQHADGRVVQGPAGPERSPEPRHGTKCRE